MDSKVKVRLIYWGSVIPLFGIIVYMYGEYKQQEHNIDRYNSISNRQVQIISKHFTDLLVKQSELHVDQLIEMENHHKQEIDECVEFYGRVLDEAKKK